MPFDPVNKVINLDKRKVTDLKGNTKVYLPKALKPTKEAHIYIGRERYREIFAEYKRKNCNKKGEQRSNLSLAQKRGLASLRKRIKNKSLVVMLTDKSGRLAVTSWEMIQKLTGIQPGEFRKNTMGTHQCG